jgi:hypothetical protein
MRSFFIALSITLLVTSGAFAYYYWPLKLQIRVPTGLEQVTPAEEHPVIFLPGQILVGELAQFDDGLFAYLMYDYYRSRPPLQGRQLLLISREGPKPLYSLLVRLPDDLMSGIELLAQLQEGHLAEGINYRWSTYPRFLRDMHQTTLFVGAYRNPSTYQLKDLHTEELQQYLRRFIRFKSLTDPRTQGPPDTVPSPLDSKEATRLAADMIAVSDFYGIPLDLLVGIGAMENNYLNFPGDLNNTIWKRHADRGDIIVKRRRGRVLVKNHSMGVWQITRESLRYAHRLYLKDTRDYSQLPERLRPPKNLDVDEVTPDVLTTYAGLLLRDLLDRFHGDVVKTAGAYNGGPKNPNLSYAAGVEMVADYARHVITRAAELNEAALSHASVSPKAVDKEEAKAPAQGAAVDGPPESPRRL